MPLTAPRRTSPLSKNFTCHVCGDPFASARPQNPDLKPGEGTCLGCRELAAVDLSRTKSLTLDAAVTHFTRHA